MDRTTLRALNVLERLVEAGAPMGVSDLARQFNLPKSNMHRVVATLEAAGYVRRTAESAYVPSLKLWELGTAVMSRMDIREIASPHMHVLVTRTGESAILAVLDGLDVVYIDKVESDQAIQAVTRVGSRLPANSVGTGKAMLAFAPASVQAAAARQAVARTSSTIVGEEALLLELETIRQRGFAVNRGEFRSEVAGVAAPVLDSRGSVIAGVGVWGPEQRFAAKLRELGEAVLACARTISHEFGMKPPECNRARSF